MSKNITINSEAITFFLTVQTELRAYVGRKIRRMPCPREIAAPLGIPVGVAVPRWTAVRNALAADPSFMDDVMDVVAFALVASERDGKLPADLEGRRRWAWTVARRGAVRMARRQARELVVPFEAPEDDHGSNGFWNLAQTAFEAPDRETIRKLDTEQFFARLRTLRPLEVRLLTIAADGGDFTEFAQAAGIPAGTVRSTWCRLRKRILDWAEADRAEEAA